jgi:hypothetical protein
MLPTTVLRPCYSAAFAVATSISKCSITDDATTYRTNTNSGSRGCKTTNTKAASFVSRSGAGLGAALPSHIAPRIRRAPPYVTSRKDDDQAVYLGTTTNNKAGKKGDITTGTDDDFQLYDPLEVHSKIIVPDSAEGKTPAGEPGKLPAVKRRIMVAVNENNVRIRMYYIVCITTSVYIFFWRTFLWHPARTVRQCIYVYISTLLSVLCCNKWFTINISSYYLLATDDTL